jgi:hypothetical protein
MHRWPEMQEPNPIKGLLDKMTSEAKERGHQFAADCAEQEVYYLAELYCHVLQSVLETARECIHLHTATVLYTRNRNVSCPLLRRRLIDQVNALATTDALLEIIESRYLRDRVMPQRLIDLLSVVMWDASRCCQLVGMGEYDENSRMLEAGECQQRAALLVSRLAPIIQSSACQASCSATLATIVRAEANLNKAVDDTIMLSQLAHETPNQPASFSERKHKSTKRSKRSKEQRTKSNAS